MAERLIDVQQAAANAHAARTSQLRKSSQTPRHPPPLAHKSGELWWMAPLTLGGHPKPAISGQLKTGQYE